MKDIDLSRNHLKYMALTSMALDHSGAVFLQPQSCGWMICRMLGRLSAPMICYFLAEGFVYTSSRKKYGERLLIGGLLSQIPYFLLGKKGFWMPGLNMILGIFLCLLILLCRESVQDGMLKGLLIGGLFFLSLYCDWEIYAPLWVLGFYIYRDNKEKQAECFSAVAAVMIFLDVLADILNHRAWYASLWELGVFLFLPVMYGYRGRKGSSSPLHKWIFYIFYPVHLWILLGAVCIGS